MPKDLLMWECQTQWKCVMLHESKMTMNHHVLPLSFHQRKLVCSKTDKRKIPFTKQGNAREVWELLLRDLKAVILNPDILNSLLRASYKGQVGEIYSKVCYFTASNADFKVMLSAKQSVAIDTRITIVRLEYEQQEGWAPSQASLFSSHHSAWYTTDVWVFMATCFTNSLIFFKIHTIHLPCGQETFTQPCS